MYKFCVLITLLLFANIESASAEENLGELIKNKNIEGVKQFLKKTPKAVNRKIPYYGFPLTIAVSKNRVKIVKFLLENGADVKVIDKTFGENIVFHLLDQPQSTTNLKKAMEIIKLLAAKKTDFNVINSKKISPLYKYCTGRHPDKAFATKLEFLQLLIDSGAKTDLKLKRDLPLLNAVLLKVLKGDNSPMFVAQLLIKNGVPINEKCKKKKECKTMTSFVEDDTPLLIVIKRDAFQPKDKSDMIKLLRENGAKKSSRNKKRETPTKLISRKSPYYDALYKTKVIKRTRK